MQLDLAIAILFFEKTDQTIACVDSFLASGCPIYVLNNGSSPEASRRFEDWSSSHSQVVLLNTPTNLGVSAGRNLLVNTATSEWLLFVDNDIKLVTPDFVAKFAKHIEKNPDIEVFVPKLFNVHEGCYAIYRQLKVVDDQICFMPANSNRINMFPGGASLISKVLFQRLGRYDENIFVGFEDFELALRGILSNAPVKTLLVADIELLHEHKANYYNIDKDREALFIRYDKSLIAKSCKIIQDKHGLVFSDPWEQWVDKQLSTMGQGELVSTHVQDVPKVLLMVDADNWAFFNIAESIQFHLQNKYDIQIKCLSHYNRNYDHLLSEMYVNRHEIIHFFCRSTILNLFLHLLQNKRRHEMMLEAFYNSKISFSVYDHALLSDNEINDFAILFKYLADSYVVSSERLFQIYSRLPSYSKPFGVIEDGVDLSKFFPAHTERLWDHDRPLVVGWVGNSKWGHNIDGIDHKGLNDIIKPAIRQLQKEGYRIKGRFADRNVKLIPHSEMVNYYNAIDIYLCASDAEGTPNPILEAMACGLPVITTDVGIVPQLFGPEQKKFILNVRSVQALKEALIILIKNPEQRVQLSNENLKQIQGWTREAESKKWDVFFTHLLCHEADSERLKCKRACLEVPYHYQFESAVDRFLETSWSWRITRPLRVVHWHISCYKNRIFRLLRMMLGRF